MSHRGKQRLDWILSPEPALDPGGPGAGLAVGVLALQGDFREHRLMLEGLGVRTREVRSAPALAGLDGLVIPGGESTTIHKLMAAYGLTGPIREFAAAGGPVFGTCAGLITLAAGTVEGAPPTLGLMDIVVRRNAFGRQVRSFEADLSVKGLGDEPMHAVFIRAPWVESAGAGVDVLATYNDRAVAVREGGILATAFHPELTDDTRLHELFIRIIRRRQGESAAPEGAAPSRTAGELGLTATAAGQR